MSDFDLAFEQVCELVAAFGGNEAHYLSPDYSEAATRKDFVDKFWTVLGWDVNHDRQTNPYEQEVKVERGVSAEGSQRRADYAFYLAPNHHDVRFYVEAKKPSLEIGTKENYFQLLRYGWNSETSLAVLTDFEQFHILDCRYKPDIDTALTRVVAQYHYRDYNNRDKFAEIYWLFSHEAVAQGSLEKRAKELPKPRGKARQRGLFPGGFQSMDEAFLAQLDEYRAELARNFKTQNPHLDSETLTELAQRTLDRLVFLRFLEDKGIEPERLVDRFGERGSAWADFLAASRRLDGIYNGIVFKRHALLDSDAFQVDDAAFADICENLAHVNSPYDFNFIPIHILGSIYERFLGKVIVATDKRAKVEEKSLVRKAGGVYYTPEYIVRYIVENTVGKLIAGKPPDQIAHLRFADIACGSGSFLLGAYDLLLSYHGHYYNQNPGKAKKGDCIQRDGKLYLSLRKKREILLNNLYGVDIDAQAVEVCQLSLYLKLLQEETEASARQYLLDFGQEALLPPLNKNIVCGNSLIGMDILEGQLFTREEERKLNPMNFEDVFPAVMKRGGFDAVIGNPPYGRDVLTDFKKYFDEHYETSQYKVDTFVFFIERATKLLKSMGKIGYIIPNTWLDTESFSRLRNFILCNTRINCVVNLGKNVFASANVDTMLLFLTLGSTAKGKITIIDASEFWHEDKRIERPRCRFSIDQSEWADDPDKRFLIHASPIERAIYNKLKRSGLALGNITDCSQGLIPYNTKELSRKNPYLSTTKKDSLWKPLLDQGSCIGRYTFIWNGIYVKFGPWLYTANQPRYYENEKILIQRHRNPSLQRRIVATLDNKRYYYKDNLCGLIQKDKQYSLKYILGVLNSTLLNAYYRKTFTEVSLNPTYLRQLPVPRINISNSADKARHDKMVRLVETMLEAKIELAKAKTHKDKDYYENKCASLDRQIDRLVYDLYGLSEDEIAVVEGTAAHPDDKGLSE